MSLPQLHYTSVTPGDGEPAGRFTAVDPAIPGPVRAEAAPILAYDAPAGTPGRLPDAQLRALPVAFGFVLLSDGSHLLSRTVATGAGGFHAHAVHLLPGTPMPGRVLPVAAWGAAGWLATTPDRMPPDPLTAMAAAHGPSRGLTREGLGDFAVARSPWLAAVLSDLRRVSEDPSGPPVVLVERQSADVARWVALATAVLPRDHAERLTFTTYTRHPGRTAHQVVGVLPEDAPDARDPRFRVHAASGPRPSGTVGRRLGGDGRPDLAQPLPRAVPGGGGAAGRALRRGAARRHGARCRYRARVRGAGRGGRLGGRAALRAGREAHPAADRRPDRARRRPYGRRVRGGAPAADGARRALPRLRHRAAGRAAGHGGRTGRRCDPGAAGAFGVRGARRGARARRAGRGAGRRGAGRALLRGARRGRADGAAAAHSPAAGPRPRGAAARRGGPAGRRAARRPRGGARAVRCRTCWTSSSTSVRRSWASWTGSHPTARRTRNDC